MRLTVLNVAYPLARVSPGTAGGAEQVLLTLDRELVRRGHMSLVLAMSGSRCNGLLLPALAPAVELTEKTRKEAWRGLRLAISSTIQQHRVDIVHMHGLDYDEYLPDTDVPIVVTMHLPLAWYKPEALRPTRDNVHLICVSQSQAATAPPDAEINSIITNGIPVTDFSCCAKKGSYALVIGRLCPEKSVHFALDAAARARVPVIIAGEVYGYPEHRDYFKREICPRLNKCVRFVGPVGGERKAHLLAGAKCLLIPSQAPETSSLAAMEAMASGTPVIAWRSGALPEIVAHGRTGWLVFSVEEMASAIGCANQINAHACRHEAEQRFSSEKMATEYLQLYRQLLKLKSSQELHAA